MSKEFSPWTIAHTIPSELAAGHRVLDELLAKLSTETWTPRELFGIRLALEEAVVNAIKHGNCLDCNKQVDVECRSTADGLWIRVEVPNGRGIMLMRNYMSRVEYNACGNVVVMEKHRAASSSRPTRA